jgi:hypothetical protein
MQKWNSFPQRRTKSLTSKMACTSIFLAIARFTVSVQRYICSILPTPVRVHCRYLISDEDEYDEDMTRVPEGSVFVEEYVRDGITKRRVLYEGDEITQYMGDPFTPTACPWLWIGDKDTEVDLTHALTKYLVPGNVINIDLLLTMIHMDRYTGIVYIDARSLEEVKFPDDGVRIHAL